MDPTLQSYPLVMMVSVTQIQNTPLPKCLFTEDIICEVFHKSVSSEHQITSVDIFNEYEFDIKIAPPVTNSVFGHEISEVNDMASN